MPSSRVLTIFQPLATVDAAVAAAFTGPVNELIPESRTCGLDTVRVRLHGAGLTREADLRVGSVWKWGDAMWRSMSWAPHHEQDDALRAKRFIPVFHGEIGLQPEQRSLVLTGSYEPPLGAIGQLADLALLGQVARSTAQNLLGEIAVNLSQWAAAPEGIPKRA